MKKKELLKEVQAEVDIARQTAAKEELRDVLEKKAAAERVLAKINKRLETLLEETV